ncbi:MAG: XRE family transcriptional regulator [Flavobacteriaceae bacterium]|nr:hypothetical protein ASG38_16840 [Flavobacterium sp. Leaf359]PZO32670.1 MAG: XRE family transcriptional regulator [Flavobacteriaceae bacterium]PZQ87364.1 MAG: XRE family transcriptional regulator [Flavobacterium johnsoniae]
MLFFCIILILNIDTDKFISRKKMIEKVLNRIKLERFKNGFSQEFVANELKISQSFYSRVESGKNSLTLDLLLKLAALFGIPPEELLK